jgi:hypothetical protein
LTGFLRRDIDQDETESYEWGLLKVQEPDSRKECPTLGVYNSSTVRLE